MMETSLRKTTNRMGYLHHAMALDMQPYSFIEHVSRPNPEISDENRLSIQELRIGTFAAMVGTFALGLCL